LPEWEALLLADIASTHEPEIEFGPFLSLADRYTSKDNPLPAFQRRVDALRDASQLEARLPSPGQSRSLPRL
jgi:hypothetical protein